MMDDINELRNIASDKITKNKEYEKNRYDQKVKEYKFVEGNRVLRAIEQQNSKFDPIWEGPFKILRAIGKGAYLICDYSGNQDSVNGDRLKHYNESGVMIPEISNSGLRPTLKRFREAKRFERDYRI
ncbi:hypothetical protein AYI68_g6671 [Smittium mucronatum]|uniref:Uncharacterized protein n=1 Tax=Smittium mucronatum TaxID=133383 RepID=A0A1R0GQT7_9FUNG|nr:hypothetical protein AYI68_g6671 [Smittium mucronatum]